jgi:hypothetical protein
MTNRTISGLTAATTPLAGTELVPVWDGATKKVTVAKILSPAAGNGIDYSANTPAAGMTSQLLNWYEEGTWTPVRHGFTEVIGGGAITNTGTYTRISRQVTVNLKIVCTGGATLAGTGGYNSYIDGLPFTPAKNSPGVWVNISTMATYGAVLVDTVANINIVTAWTASSSTWDFVVVYTV